MEFVESGVRMAKPPTRCRCSVDRRSLCVPAFDSGVVFLDRRRKAPLYVPPAAAIICANCSILSAMMNVAVVAPEPASSADLLDGCCRAGHLTWIGLSPINQTNPPSWRLDCDHLPQVIHSWVGLASFVDRSPCC